MKREKQVRGSSKPSGNNSEDKHTHTLTSLDAWAKAIDPRLRVSKTEGDEYSFNPVSGKEERLKFKVCFREGKTARWESFFTKRAVAAYLADLEAKTKSGSIDIFPVRG